MKQKLSILLLAFLFINISSCKQSLDLQPLDRYADDAVWNNDPALIQAFVNNIYNGLGQQGIRVMLGTYVDESMLTFGWGTDVITKSQITPSNLGIFSSLGSQSGYYVWENTYRYIRACNVFFKNIDGAKAMDDAGKKALKGEVHFLRAYLYSMLVSMYGGVPIIEKAYDLNEDYLVSRNTYEQCVKFISDECDLAGSLIVSGEKGRPTKGAALALKARMLLYAASDLYNSNASWAAGYAHPELVGYVGGDRKARWQAAKDAAKAVMNMGYDLYKKDPAPGDDIAKNYSDIFLLKETPEDIFVKYTLPSVSALLVMPNVNNSPNGYYGRGANTPLAQLIDDYEMNDGTKFDWNNAVEAAKPYENREPRFYASILYDGARWRQRPPDAVGLDPVGIIQTGDYEKWDPATNSVVLVYGLDTQNGPITNWNGTRTGYWIRKGIDPSVDPEYFNQDIPWRFIRYTEVLLNYAEACLGLGEENEAKIYINIIRKRAGLPPVTETGQALIDRYRHERRIELAFEDHRFFDVRRWMIAPQAYTDARGIQILHKLNPDKVTTTAVYTQLPSVQQRAWQPKFYFIPISIDELNKNNKLIQNPLY
jgi:hypothetical protein